MRKILFTSLFLVYNYKFIRSQCAKGCSGHGTCGANNLCTCYDNWEGVDCSLRQCPKGTPWFDYASANNIARATTTECSNMGICDRATGKCKCHEGFHGLSCGRKKCHKDCNGHGDCLSMSEAAAEKNDYNLFYATTYTTIWDANMMYGCVCDKGYEGSDCSLYSCPKGDDPMTTGQVDEVQSLSCLCNGCSGTFIIAFRDESTASLPTTATATEIKTALEGLSSVNGVTVSFDGGTTVCDSDGVSSMITFTHNSGDIPAISVTSTLTGGTNALTVQTDGTNAAYGSTPATVKGTKEAIACSGRGSCDVKTGSCTCATNFASSNGAGALGILGDCGYINATSISACPSSTCSGHGTCSGSTQYLCTCYVGWHGHDCSKIDCPKGRSWWGEAASSNTGHTDLVECSNMGICDTSTGVCTCFTGFEGISCNRMSCPIKDKAACSGHGLCKSMSELAALTKVNGVVTPYSYGTDHNAASTWDANSIFGCHCDQIRQPFGDLLLYQGYDCSQLSCPSGDDPWTTGQVDEKQTISCTATGGSFKLTFKGETTALIAYDATATTVKEKLEALITIGIVTVSFQTGAVACSSGGVSIDVVFNSNSGDVPLLTLDSTALTGSVSTNVVQTTLGTKEYISCNRRGNCNKKTGQCECEKHYISSNGYGGLGTMNDCGYLDELMTSKKI